MAGPDTGPVPIAPVPKAVFTGLRFRPGAAPGFLGVPASALRDQRVDASEVLGARARPLVDHLAGASHRHDAAASLERAALGWLRRAHGQDPLVEAAGAPPSGLLAAWRPAA